MAENDIASIKGGSPSQIVLELSRQLAEYREAQAHTLDDEFEKRYRDTQTSMDQSKNQKQSSDEQSQSWGGWIINSAVSFWNYLFGPSEEKALQPIDKTHLRKIIHELNIMQRNMEDASKDAEREISERKPTDLAMLWMLKNSSLRQIDLNQQDMVSRTLSQADMLDRNKDAIDIINKVSTQLGPMSEASTTLGYFNAGMTIIFAAGVVAAFYTAGTSLLAVQAITYSAAGIEAVGVGTKAGIDYVAEGHKSTIQSMSTDRQLNTNHVEINTRKLQTIVDLLSDDRNRLIEVAALMAETILYALRKN